VPLGRRGLCGGCACVHAHRRSSAKPHPAAPRMLATCCPPAAPAALNPEAGGVVWPGVAGVFQVAFILGAGLVFFVARTPVEGDSYASF